MPKVACTSLKSVHKESSCCNEGATDVPLQSVVDMRANVCTNSADYEILWSRDLGALTAEIEQLPAFGSLAWSNDACDVARAFDLRDDFEVRLQRIWNMAQSMSVSSRERENIASLSWKLHQYGYFGMKQHDVRTPYGLRYVVGMTHAYLSSVYASRDSHTFDAVGHLLDRELTNVHNNLKLSVEFGYTMNSEERVLYLQAKGIAGVIGNLLEHFTTGLGGANATEVAAFSALNESLHTKKDALFQYMDTDYAVASQHRGQGLARLPATGIPGLALRDVVADSPMCSATQTPLFSKACGLLGPSCTDARTGMQYTPDGFWWSISRNLMWRMPDSPFTRPEEYTNLLLDDYAKVAVATLEYFHDTLRRNWPSKYASAEEAITQMSEDEKRRWFVFVNEMTCDNTIGCTGSMEDHCLNVSEVDDLGIPAWGNCFGTDTVGGEACFALDVSQRAVQCPLRHAAIQEYEAVIADFYATRPAYASTMPDVDTPRVPCTELRRVYDNPFVDDADATCCTQSDAELAQVSTMATVGSPMEPFPETCTFSYVLEHGDLVDGTVNGECGASRRERLSETGEGNTVKSFAWLFAQSFLQQLGRRVERFVRDTSTECPSTANVWAGAITFLGTYWLDLAEQVSNNRSWGDPARTLQTEFSLVGLALVDYQLFVGQVSIAQARAIQSNNKWEATFGPYDWIMRMIPEPGQLQAYYLTTMTLRDVYNDAKEELAKRNRTLTGVDAKQFYLFFFENWFRTTSSIRDGYAAWVAGL